MASVYFLNVSVEHSKAFLLALEIALGFFHNTHDQAHGKGEYHDSHQGHPDADGYHHDQDAHQGRNRGDDLRKALVQGLAYRIHVIGDAGQYLAVGPGVVVA